MTLKAMVFIFLTLSFAGCAKHYPAPVIEVSSAANLSKSFAGLIDQVEGGRPLRVVWLHGMCHHGTSWVEKRSKLISQKLQADVRIGKTSRIDKLRVYRRSFWPRTGGPAIEVDFVVYSKFSSLRKAFLYGGEDAYLEKHSDAKINSQLKQELLNSCVSDAVFYVGSASLPMRNSLDEYLCGFLGGHYTRSSGCIGVDPKENRTIVAESLGSKIILDSWASLKLKTRSRKQINLLEDSFRAVSNIYLISNQFTFLSIGDATHPRQKVIQGVRGLGKRRNSRDKNLTIVSFSDPNDVLSYELKHWKLGLRPQERVVNVLTSNAPTIVKQLENPYEAHTGYERNDAVFSLLICGSDAKVRDSGLSVCAP